MKIQIKALYELTLVKNEVRALKIILGARTQKSDIQNGLSADESELISDLYDLLPHIEDK